ncbi:MAG: LPD7 domain-containing protein, partial [Telluria sp.]
VEHSIIEARQEVGKWTGANTIERVDAPQRKPVAPAHVNLDKQAPELPAGIPAPLASDFNLTMIPPEVERVYLRDGHKFYHPKNQKLVAFEDHGKQLKTTQSSGPVAMAMVQIAEARGWKEIKVSGTEEFRKEAWREAAMRGIGVQGYKPTSLDLAELARRTPKKDAENNVAPTPQATQHGAYINADDAALMAAVKAARWGTARAPEAAPVAPTATPARTAAPVQHAAPVMPTTSAVQGDVLVAHGAARYEHDKDNPMSYFVTVANDQGKERTIWGVKLGEAIEKSGVETGDRISLIKNGETQVEVAANVKNDQGVVIAKEKIGAKRNEWAVKAHAFATRPAEQVVQAHQDLAGVVAIAAAIDQRAQADGYKPNERAYIEQRVREIATRSIASGNAPTLLYREACQATNHPQQERMQ